LKDRVWKLPDRFSLFGVLLLLMAVPRPASAYVDPGSGAMLWQMGAAALIGGLFYVRRIVMWLRGHFKLRSPRAMGFLFASCFALVVSPLVLGLFSSRPVPQFNDIFLVGIVLTCYLFAWEPAAFLLAISILVSAWVLPPNGSLAIAHAEDWYRLCSFTAVSIFLIWLVTRMKARAASATPDDDESVLIAPGVAAQ
jgi:hypothetical protein